jgi:hypothetical protein
MNKAHFKLSIYIDKHLGDFGFCIWILPLALLFFSGFSYIAINISFLRHLWNSEGVIFLVLMHFISTGSVLWFAYEIKTALKIIQEIQIKNNTIYITLYFRKKLKIEFGDLLSSEYLRENSYFLKKHRCVQTEAPCMQIKTKDNRTYLITPHMERFDELKNKLEEIVLQNKVSNE